MTNLNCLQDKWIGHGLLDHIFLSDSMGITLMVYSSSCFLDLWSYVFERSKRPWLKLFWKGKIRNAVFIFLPVNSYQNGLSNCQWSYILLLLKPLVASCELLPENKNIKSLQRHLVFLVVFLPPTSLASSLSQYCKCWAFAILTYT